jgi:uncharacterized protein (DUF2062 family)
MVRFPRVRRWLEQLLHTHDTPERTAGAFALGIFLGFSPLLGLHTILGLILAFALNLNRLAVLLGVYSNLPWILVPYYTVSTWLGAAILGLTVPPGVVEALIDSLEDRSWSDFRSALGKLKPFVWAFTLGSTIAAALLALFAYRGALAMIVSHRRHQHRPQDPQQ